MRPLIVFNNVSLDGFFCDAHGDMQWAHNRDPEWQEFTRSNARGGGEAIYGRKTYEMMASYWPTPAAAQQNPVTATAMNTMAKHVFSRTLAEATWSNTTLHTGDLAGTIRELKAKPGPALVIMGSGTLVSQLAPTGLVDELQLVVHPLILGKGRTLFETVTERVPLKLLRTRAFENGNVVVTYGPC